MSGKITKSTLKFLLPRIVIPGLSGYVTVSEVSTSERPLVGRILVGYSRTATILHEGTFWLLPVIYMVVYVTPIEFY